MCSVANQKIQEKPTKSKQKTSETPSILSLITKQDIEDNGYNSIPEALNSIPGFYMTYDNYNYNLSIRGINGGIRGWNRVLKIMINGKNIAMSSDSTTLLGPETIPMELVEQIEIIRGPASALYGPNAFLGAINIITKSENSDTITAKISSSATKRFIDDSTGTAYVTEGYQANISASKKMGIFDVNLGLTTSNENRSGQSISDTSPLTDPNHSDYSTIDKFYSTNDNSKSISSKACKYSSLTS